MLEYVEGAPPAAPETPRKLLDLAVQIADGMAATHAAGFVHRDLKPDNILVTGDSRVKILDFGLAKQSSVPKTAGETQPMGDTDPGAVLGTLYYMSPEQARGQQVDARADQFSFGLILYELASGCKGNRPLVIPDTREYSDSVLYFKLVNREGAPCLISGLSY